MNWLSFYTSSPSTPLIRSTTTPARAWPEPRPAFRKTVTTSTWPQVSGERATRIPTFSAYCDTARLETTSKPDVCQACENRGPPPYERLDQQSGLVGKSINAADGPVRYRLLIGQANRLCRKQHLVPAHMAASLYATLRIASCSDPSHRAAHICSRNRGIRPSRSQRELATRRAGGPLRLRHRHR